MSVRVLVLNASYEFLNVTSWQRAVVMVLLGKADVLEKGEDSIRSATIRMRVPSVIRMRYYIKTPRRMVKFSRENIFKRDGYSCQYCGRRRDTGMLTIDHLVPRSRGGEDDWHNVVTCCRECNGRKGDRTPQAAGLMLRSMPREPNYYSYLVMAYNIDQSRPEWRKYLPELTLCAG